jgi:DNA-binding response OmpR family regulator
MKRSAVMTALAAAPCLLIAEDEDEIREALQFVLSEEGYQVMAATSLAEALALLHEQTFDFVLTDLFHTPGHPPLHSVQPLLTQAAPTPIGIMTAWNLSEQEVHQAGFACLIQKPFDLDAVMATIASVINKALTPEQVKQARTV